jgi:molybdate-binding protein/transcriptional regulator with XRE-family HTH domain
MSDTRQLKNQVRARRLARPWSQAELAERAGISRAAVSAIEIGRLVPSVAAALSLAETLDCSVEDLFRSGSSQASEPAWAWPPSRESCRLWQATVGGRNWLYPVETTAAGVVEHDGILENGSVRTRGRFDPEKTLVLACCDPAASLLAGEISRRTDLRVLVLTRSSQQALSLLAQGIVHIAGVHLSSARAQQGNARAVRNRLGSGFTLLRVARWQEGLALPGQSRIRSVSAAVHSKLRWIGREPGSGARQCLDQLLNRQATPRRVAHDHRGVAEAIRCGWADAGVCLRLVCEEAGLRFLSVREEIYELCFPRESEGDFRIRALMEAVRSASYRQVLSELPGYNPVDCGEIQHVT